MSELIKCPFDPLHQVAANKFGKHLTKCQRQHPNVHLEKCPLNSFHLLKPDELKEHLRTCSSRKELEAYKYSMTMASSSAPVEELIINTGASGSSGGGGGFSLQDEDDCWDNSNYQAYDPLRKCIQQRGENKHFIIPCANKFVVPNSSIALVKEELQCNATEEEKEKERAEPTVKAQPLPDDVQWAAAVKEEPSGIEDSSGPSVKYRERQDHIAYGRGYDTRDCRAANYSSYERFDRHGRDNAAHRSAPDRDRYQPQPHYNKYDNDRHMGRHDRLSYESSSRRPSEAESRHRFKPYQSSYSRSQQDHSDTSNRYFNYDRKGKEQ